MNDLRLALLLAGFAILAGLYIRERLRSRDNPSRDDAETEADNGVDNYLKISARSGEEDYSSVLSALKKDRSRARDNDEIEPVKNNARPADGAETGNGGQAGIIILHVMAEPGKSYHGRDLLSAFEDLGLVFGDMQIFHHYGVGDMRTDRPLFHLADMLEPGSFDPDGMDDFTTRGLSLFMQLPPPLDPEAVFELMLSSARQLTEKLGGRIMNQDRQPLDDVHTELLRARVRASA